jgi:acyl-CoA synthetase (AMP-forming)/AMP-acid ligase II
MLLYNSLKIIASKYPNKIAIRTNEESITYQDLIVQIDEIAERLSKRITSLGIKKIALIAKTGIQETIFLFAASKANLKILTVNPELTINQRNTLMQACGIDIALIVKKLNKVDIGNLRPFDSYWELLEVFNSNLDIIDGLSQDDFLITGSSGSTGAPKPLVFSQSTKILRMIQSRDLYKIGPDSVILNASPIFHSLGQRLTFLPLLNGGELVILKKFNPDNWAEKIIKEKVSFTIAVSTHLQSIIPKWLNGEFADSRLQSIVSSSAAINKVTKNLLFENGRIEFHEQYGASEVATVTNCNKELYRNYPDSIGEVCDNVELEIRNQKNDGVGDVFIRSKLAYSGFMKDGSLIRHDNNTFIEVGDVGSLNESRIFFFKGRSRDVINVGGQNVYSADISKKIQEMTGINECVVLAVVDKYFGEKPIALITLKPNSEVSKSDLNSWCFQNMPNFQRPHDFMILDNLQRLPSGKYDLIGMRKIYLDSISNKQ